MAMDKFWKSFKSGTDIRGVAVDGAAKLLYDAEQDGWYMGERLEDPEDVRLALAQAGAWEP